MIEVYKKENLTKDDINAWEKLWNELDTAHFFNSYNWYIACRSGLQDNINVWFSYVNNNLIGVFLLYKKRRYGINCLCSANQIYSDKCSILLDNDHKDALVDILFQIAGHLPIVLDEVPESWGYDLNNQTIKEESSVNPYVRLDEDILCQVKKKEWNSIKNKAKNSTFSLEIFFSGEAHAKIDYLWEIEEKSNKPVRKRATFKNEAVKKMYELASDSKEAVLAILFDDQKPIAHMFGYNIKEKTFHAHHMAFVQEYFHKTPGKLLIYLLIEQLRKMNFWIFDFSRGETLLKKQYAKYREWNCAYYYSTSLPVKMWFRICIYVKNFYKAVKQLLKEFYQAYIKP